MIRPIATAWLLILTAASLVPRPDACCWAQGQAGVDRVQFPTDQGPQFPRGGTSPVPEWLRRYYTTSGGLLPDRVGKNHELVKAAFRSVVAPASQSTVRVIVHEKQVALGTIVDPDGFIVTKSSELVGPITCQLHGGRTLPARIVGESPEHDLALLKVDAVNLSAMQLASRPAAGPGTLVATVGPLTDPLAIGVVGLGPSAIARPRAVIGIVMEQAEAGPRITRILAGSGADRAGLRADDIIIALDGREVPTRRSLTRLMEDYLPGDTVKVRIWRGEKEIHLATRLGLADEIEGPINTADVELAGELSVRRRGFPSVLQHDTVVQPSQCGGPLVDVDGNLVGINIARASRIATYAVPADVVRSVLNDLRAGQLVTTERWLESRQ